MATPTPAELLDQGKEAFNWYFFTAPKFPGRIPPSDGPWKSVADSLDGPVNALFLRQGDYYIEVQQFPGHQRTRETSIWLFPVSGDDVLLNLTRFTGGGYIDAIISPTGGQVPLDAIPPERLERVQQLLDYDER